MTIKYLNDICVSQDKRFRNSSCDVNDKVSVLTVFKVIQI